MWLFINGARGDSQISRHRVGVRTGRGIVPHIPTGINSGTPAIRLQILRGDTWVASCDTSACRPLVGLVDIRSVLLGDAIVLI